MCTHIVYAFFGVSYNGDIEYMNHHLDDESKNIESLIAMKRKNAELKIIASIGGPQVSSRVFSVIASNDTSRETFAANVLEFIESWGFDGVDIHWEHQEQTMSESVRDNENFSLMLKKLKEK